jgi:uncharacterized peroxidase-related enzyme
MPFIRLIDEVEAQGHLKDLYNDIIKSRGKLSNIMRIHSLIPDTMIKHMELYKSIMFEKSNLPRVLKEMIAVVVSITNKCDYCIKHHAEAINYYWKDTDKLNKFILDYRSIDLQPEVIAILDYTYTLTSLPNTITMDSVNELKKFNWSDEDILLANLIVSYFNFVNRIALGLGVEFTEEEIKGYKY